MHDAFAKNAAKPNVSNPAFRVLGTVAGVTLAVLIALEVLVRAFQWSSPIRVDQTASPHVLGDLKPNQLLWSREIPRVPYQVRVNSQGLRGAELSPLSPDRQRMLILGDSFVFGQLVSDGETLPDQLSKRFKTETNRKIEVINAGRCGYTINDELSYYLDRGRHLKPQSVVLVYTLSDPFELAWGWKRREDSLRRGQFRASGSKLTVLEDAMRHSASLYFLQERMWEWTLRTGKPLTYHGNLSAKTAPYEPPTPEYLAASEAHLRLLAQLKKAVEDDGANFVFVLFPNYQQMNPAMGRYPQDLILEKTKSWNMKTVDLLPAFLASGESESTLYYAPFNNHPKPLGYQLAAQVLFEPLLKSLPDEHGGYLNVHLLDESNVRIEL